MKELNYNGILIGTAISSDPLVYKTIDELKYKLFYPIPVSPDTSNGVPQYFVQNFQKKFGKSPPGLADVGYDAVMLFIKH